MQGEETVSAMAFDTHYFVKMMTEKGFTEPQAEVVVQMQASVLNSQIATQAGLDALRLAMQADLEQLEITTKADIAEVKADIALVRSEMRELSLQITIRLGGMIAALGGILIAIKYFG